MILSNPSTSEEVVFNKKDILIMVVDDEPDICSILEEYLTSEGFQVHTFTNAQEALANFDRYNYHLIVTDIMMPRIDGLSLVQTLKGRNPDLASVIITGYASLESAIRAIRGGVDDYVTKPFDLDTVLTTVDKSLKKYLKKNQKTKILHSLHSANGKLKELANNLAHRVRIANKNLLQANYDLKRRLSELAILNEVSSAITRILNLEKLLGLCLKLVSTKIGSRSSSIMLLDDNREYLEVKAYNGPENYSTLGLRQKVGEGVSGWVAEHKRPLLIKDIDADPRFVKRRGKHYPSKSLISVPLLSKNRLLGVININDKTTGGTYNMSDLKLLCTIASQIAITIENAKLYKAMQENSLNMINSLAVTLEAKDKYTSGHSIRVTNYAVAMAKLLRLDDDEVELIKHSASLHDIGKIGISETILLKPASLTSEEFDVIKEHPIIGERIISSLDFLTDVRHIIRHHHERLDGSGYPDGLAADAVSIPIRIMAVADSYDAMTSERPYRKAMTAQAAIEELHNCSPEKYDPAIISALENVLATSYNFEPTFS